MPEGSAVTSAPSLWVPEVLGHPYVDALVTLIFLGEQSSQEICADKGIFSNIRGHFFLFLSNDIKSHEQSWAQRKIYASLEN